MRKAKLWTNFADETRLWDLVLLYGISHHLIDLSTELQGQQKLNFDMFMAGRAFEMKSNLFRKQLENNL
jgi:hypothetical protein